MFPASAANAADTLTSQYINLQTINSLTLQPSDSVALIFYYQLAGNGDSPEPQDSLIVDFYSKYNGWVSKVWAKPGLTTANPNDTLLNAHLFGLILQYFSLIHLEFVSVIKHQPMAILIIGI